MDQEEEDIARRNLLTICNAIYHTDFKSIDVVGAVLLSSILRDDPASFKQYIQERGDNFLEIMENDEFLSQIHAAQSSGITPQNTEESEIFDPVISGRSPRAVERSPRGLDIQQHVIPLILEDVGMQDVDAELAAEQERAEHARQAQQAQQAQQAETRVYTDLMTFINNTMNPGRRAELCQLMYNLIDSMREFISIIPLYGVANVRIYNNIQLVAGELPEQMPRRPAQIFPKFSFNILCRKEPLLQTVLVAGRENGMGKTLNTFVFTQLQQFFGPDVILKIVEPTESNRLWQVKISIHKNDFIFFTIQIINVKDELFAGVRPIDPINPIDDARLLQISQNPALYDTYFQLFENLLFLLYNKSNSKDFNCLCSLSEIDIYLFRLITSNPNNTLTLLQYIRTFLVNLIDTQPNIKKRYFFLGLSNLIFCSAQQDYTIETRAYRWLFDQPVPRLNVFQDRGQSNKNVFLHAMRLIQQTNTTSRAAMVAGQREPIQVVTGGGKQYSIFQKALHRFSLMPTSQAIFNESMQRIIDGIYNTPHRPIPIIDYPPQEQLLRELRHEAVKAAADLDAGFFHPEGVVGYTQCMAVCMLLQVSLKKLVDHLTQQGGVYDQYEIDIGNSCIGNPPTTLSSLRIVLNNSLLFYNNFDEIYQRLITELGIDLQGISSVISPFDYVPKGSMIEYIKHIIEAVSLFGDIGLTGPEELNTLSELLSRYCMVTPEGFSSSLKGIFDIFYTLFIIENFANRTLVTQKINKELKRISISAQILYLHYVELIPLVNDGAVIIQPMLDILKDMISYGYAGNLLEADQFNIIMQKYVQFVRKLIELNRNPQRLLLNYYCTQPMDIQLPRALTQTEVFFMSLLENSIDENGPEYLAPVALPGDISVSLGCIPHAIAAIQGMDHRLLARLCQNKIYAAYRDTENKKNSVVVISIAYQNFLWDTNKRGLIKVGNIVNDEEDNRMFHISQGDPGMLDLENDSAIGLLDIFRDTPDFFNELIGAVEPCYNNRENPHQNLLDISFEVFDNIHINPTMKFQFILWFLTCIFGVKTKSAVKKIISLARTYLNSIKDNIVSFPRIEDGQILGCAVRFPALPEPRPARIELHGFLPAAGVPGNFNPNSVLCVAYDPYAIDKALQLYRNIEATFRADPDNYVFKIANTIAIRKDSAVLRRDVIERLTTAFSKLPRGQVYVNQSYSYMGPILHGVNRIVRDFMLQAPQEMFVENFLQNIREIPELLSENPYKPTAHDVSKFVDYQENPQYYRNKWIIYFIQEIFNSRNDVMNLFNHMKLFILLFRYLTLLPTTDINHTLVIINPETRTTPETLENEEQLIDQNYTCDRVAVRQIPPQVAREIVEETIEAHDEIQLSNTSTNQVIADAAAAADAAPRVNRRRGTRSPASAAPAVPPPAAAANQGNNPPPQPLRGRRNVAAPALPPALPPRVVFPVADVADVQQPTKRNRRGGKINNHTRKLKYKRINKVKRNKPSNVNKPNKSNKSNKQNKKNKKSNIKMNKNVTFKRRRR